MEHIPLFPFENLEACLKTDAAFPDPSVANSHNNLNIIEAGLETVGNGCGRSDLILCLSALVKNNSVRKWLVHVADWPDTSGAHSSAGFSSL